MTGKRKLAIVLHTHLPWVLNHGTWPHGEDWLFEATTHCYLPLIAMLQGRQKRGATNQLTVTVSPVLAAQWRHPSFPEKLVTYLKSRESAAREFESLPLAGFWRETFAERLRFFQAIDYDLPGALARLAHDGVIELGSCAATHAYLPLVHDLRSAQLSVRLAQAFHRHAFGKSAAGMWLPECAYRPAGPFRHPVTGVAEPFRPGLEEVLETAGFAWTVLDAHLLLGGKPVASSAANPQHEEPLKSASLYHPASLSHSRVAAFFRDPHTSLQVWSRDYGYPGEERYLDFHKRHWPSGLKLWRVTHPKADLADKLPYDPEATVQAVESHAHHFLEVVAGIAEAQGGVVVAPFDTELFGHWWFEGIAFLEKVLEKTETHPYVQVTTPSLELAEASPVPVELPEGSWGEGGDHRVWVNPQTEHFWTTLAPLEAEAWQTLSRGVGGDRSRSQIVHELLLALASDWPFLVTTQAARDYAERRFALHSQRLRELLAKPEGLPPAWSDEDEIFPQGLVLSVLRSLTTNETS